jgi:hypothetical protein
MAQSNCYVCSSILLLNRDISLISRFNQVNCGRCGMSICDYYTGNIEQYLVCHSETNKDRYCVRCFSIVYPEFGGISCYVCCKMPDLPNRLIMTIDGYFHIVYSACNAEHCDRLLEGILPLREGWCRNCNLLHTSTGIDRVRIDVLRYHIMDISNWYSFRSWLAWLQLSGQRLILWSIFGETIAGIIEEVRYTI